MANNHRQIFHVHGGDLKSLAKYTMRMIEGWRKLGLNPPADALGISTNALYERARKIYQPKDQAEIDEVLAKGRRGWSICTCTTSSCSSRGTSRT